VENSLHFNLMDFPVYFIKQFVSCFLSRPNFIIGIPVVLLFTLHIIKNIAYYITEVLMFYADKLIVMSSSKNLCVLISQFYSNHDNFMLAKYIYIYIYMLLYVFTVCQRQRRLEMCLASHECRKRK